MYGDGTFLLTAWSHVVVNTARQPPVIVRGRSAFAIAMLMLGLFNNKPLDAMISARTHSC